VILAEEVLHTTLATLDKEQGRRSPTSVVIASTLAGTLWENDRPEEAETVMSNRLDLLERIGSPESITMGYITASRVAAAGGNERRAFDLLDYLCTIGELRTMPRLCLTSIAEQIRLHARHGRVETCSALLDRMQVRHRQLMSMEKGILSELGGILVNTAAAYVALARRDTEAALLALDAADEPARRLNRGRDAIRLRLLRALALHRRGDDGTALLDEASSLAEALGLKRILADTHPDLVDWMRTRAGGQKPEPGTAAPAAHAAPQRPDVRRGTGMLLTPKELDVLGLMAVNMSNKQIAQALCVSDTTVKWHIKNLFSKLNAGTRRHVVDRARVLGILDAAG
jgi:LuxR family maltose regulon positive regulatory protein